MCAVVMMNRRCFLPIIVLLSLLSCRPQSTFSEGRINEVPDFGSGSTQSTDSTSTSMPSTDDTSTDDRMTTTDDTMPPPDDSMTTTDDMMPSTDDSMTMMPVTPPVQPRDFSFMTRDGTMYTGRFDGTSSCVVQGMVIAAALDEVACMTAFEASYQDEFARSLPDRGGCVTYSGVVVSCADRSCRSFSGIPGLAHSCLDGRSLAAAESFGRTEPTESDAGCGGGVGMRLVLGHDGGGICSGDVVSLSQHIDRRLGRLYLGAPFGDGGQAKDMAVIVFDGQNKPFMFTGLVGASERQGHEALEARMQQLLAPDKPDWHPIGSFGRMQFYGMHASMTASNYNVLQHDAMGVPYMAMLGRATAASVRYDGWNGHQLTLMFGMGQGGQTLQEQAFSQHNGMIAMLGYQPFDGMMLRLGALQEKGSLLASSGHGVFALRGGMTLFTDMRVVMPITEDWQGIMRMTIGNTQQHESGGIIDTIDVMTTSFAVGVQRQRLFASDDYLLLHMRQPMRVEDGHLAMRYVSSHDGLATQRYDVTPSGRTLEWGLGYGMPLALPLSSSVTMRVALDYVHEKGHRYDGSDEMVALIGLWGAF